MRKYRVAVIRGGRSNEREISLQSGANVERALSARGHAARGMDLDSGLFRALMNREFDAAFIALHGKWGEDGTLQGMLEIFGVPYTGSGVLGSALAMDKITAKKIFEREKIPTPKWEEIEGPVIGGKLPRRPPFVVKPSRGGSTRGMSLVRDSGRYPAALKTAFDSDDRVFAEEYIEGKELTVGILGKNEAKALPVVEILLDGFFDYDSKYTPGRSKHRVPAPLEKKIYGEVQDLAVRSHQALGCRHFSRVDIRLSPENRPYVLDVNTIPGLTDVSLFPEAAKAAGISFEDLAELLVQWAVEP